MPLHDLPPTCEALAPSHSADSHLCLPALLPCGAEATHRVTAYATASATLPAIHTALVCAAHAQPLADRWPRGRGVRPHGYARPQPVVAVVTEYRHAAGRHAYRHHLGEHLPGMPADPVQPERSRRRPPATYSAVATYTTTSGTRYGVLYVDPYDGGGLGRARRETVCILARALDLSPAPAPSIKGPWSDRLNLRIDGPVDRVRAFAAALPWLLRQADHGAADQATAYGRWARRHHPDISRGEINTMRREWRREFMPAWAHRYTEHLARALGSGQHPLLQWRAPRADDETFGPRAAAHAHADARWADLLWYQSAEAGAVGIPQAAGRLILAPRVPVPAGLPIPAPRTPQLHAAPAPAEPPAQLWTDPPDPQPEPEPAPLPQGRPLLEVLARDLLESAA